MAIIDLKTPVKSSITRPQSSSHQQIWDDGNDVGERSLEKKGSVEAKTPKELEKMADTTRDHALAFEKTKLAEDSEYQIFAGQRQYQREEEFTYVENEKIAEKPEASKARIKEKIRLLLIQMMADVLKAQKRFPQLISEVQQALSEHSTKDAREQLDKTGENLIEIRSQLRGIAHVYFSKGYGLMREFQKTYPEDFSELLGKVFDEYYREYGHSVADRPKDEYFASSFLNDIIQVTAGEGIEAIHEEITKALAVFDKASDDELSLYQQKQLDDVSERVEVVAARVKENTATPARATEDEEQLAQAA